MFLLYCKVKKTSMRKKTPFLHHSFVAFLGATTSTARYTKKQVMSFVNEEFAAKSLKLTAVSLESCEKALDTVLKL